MEAPGRFSAKRAGRGRRADQHNVCRLRRPKLLDLLGAEPGLLTIVGIAFIKPEATVTTKKPLKR